MIRHIVMLYPPAFRRRYGPEIAELLERSQQPGRDALDVAVHAVRLHWEELISNWSRHASSAAVAVTLLLLGYVVNDLSDGLTEIHRPWWSMLAVTLVVAAAGVRLIVTSSTPRRQRRSAER